MKEWIAVLQERSMTYKRLWLLFLRQYYIWRTKRHIQLAKGCEEKRLKTLRRLGQEDLLKPHEPLKHKWLVKLFREVYH